jgi:hypothetical protein
MKWLVEGIVHSFAVFLMLKTKGQDTGRLIDASLRLDISLMPH